jgi:hAT family C-terminal dimerisation region
MSDDLMDDTPTCSSDDELQHYLATDVEDVKDALMWWHERCTSYPRLSRMARDYLAIPGKFLAF